MGLPISTLFVTAFMFCSATSHAAIPGLKRVFGRRSCDSELTNKDFPSEQAALVNLLEQLPILYPDTYQDLPFYKLAKHYAEPSLRFDSRLVVGAIVGGPGEGKSTLLNSMPSLMAPDVPPGEDGLAPADYPVEVVSPVGRRGNTTQRTVVGVGTAQGPSDNTSRADLNERMKPAEYGDHEWSLNPVRDLDVIRAPGEPVLTSIKNLPSNFAMLDMTNNAGGDPRLHPGPEHAASADRATIPADVLLLMLDQRTIAHFSTRQTIRELFDTYGYKQIIPILGSSKHMPPEEALEILTTAANIYYDRPEDSVDMPDGVVGTYQKPYDDEVDAGRKNVTLIGLGGTPPLRDLINRISTDPREFKKYSMTAASRSINASVGADVRREMKMLLATQIYDQAVQALAYTIARESVRPFPFAEGSRRWRNYTGFIRRRTPEESAAREENPSITEPFVERKVRHSIADTLNRVAEFVGKPESALRGGGEDQASLPLTEDELLQQDRRIVMQLQYGLASGVLSLIKHPKIPDRRKAGDQLQAVVAEFERLFPEEKLGPAACATDGGHVCVRLPRRELLPENVRRQVERLIQRDPLDVVTEVKDDLKHSQMTISSRDVNGEMTKQYMNRGRFSKAWDATLNAGTLAAGFYGAMWMLPHFEGTSWAAIVPTLAFGSLCARFPRMWVESRLDRRHREPINKWFRKIQFEAISDVLNGRILKDLKQQLQPTRSERTKALKEVQRSLKFLDPQATPYPDKIEVYVKHSH